MCRLLTIVALAWSPGLHALHAEAKIRGPRVVIEAYYDDDTPAANAQVTITDKSGCEIASGRTDERGVWSFPRPKPEKYQLSVDDGMGHKTRVPVTIPADSAFGNRPAGAAEDEIVITSGPTRTEVTRYPWLRLGLGIAAISGLAVVLFVAMRKRTKTQGPVQ
jgi:hypothetical protein